MRRVRAVVAQRRILALLIVRDLKVKYAESTLGYLWTILDPLLLAGVYYFVFTVIRDRGYPGYDPFIVFLLAGLLPWGWASGVIIESCRAINAEAKLVRSTSMPREVWILRLILSRFVEFLFSLPILGIFLVIYGVGVGSGVMWWPVAFLLEGSLLLGIALMLAPVAVLVRDVKRVVRIVVRLLFYFCPVLYTATLVLDNPKLPEFLKVVYMFNPFTSILGLFRVAFFPQDMPDWDVLAASGGICLLTLGLGAMVFRRLEGPVLKEI